MLSFGKLKLHSSFLLFVFLIIALGWTERFFLVILAVTLHELAHVFAAAAFRLKIVDMVITPIGEAAHIEGFDGLPAAKKYMVLLAGPLTNIVLFFIIFSLFREKGALFAYSNLVIGFFNLLPIYPMDGGRMMFVLLGNRLGILKSVPYIRFLARAGAFVLLAAGFVQLVLFPLNVSLLAVGVFFASIFKREKSSMLFSYYNCMLQKKAALKARTHVLSGETPLSAAESIFTWDYRHIIFVVGDNGGIIAILTEKQVFDAAIAYGMSGETKLLDIIAKNDIL